MSADSQNDFSRADKKKSLEIAIKQIERQFGKNSIMKLGDSSFANVDKIPTGSLSIDIALGIGGLPCGRVIELYGNESSGKTTIALSVIAECQKRGGSCAFIDAEHALDPEYSRKLGVNTDELLISQPDHGEQALEIADTLVRSGGVDLIVIDSVAALVPKAELTGEMEDQNIGLQARLMSKALRKITGSISKTNTVVIFINQVRMKIGSYGNPETTTGGNALKFYASVRMEIRKGKVDTKGEEMVGMEVKAKIVKNKMAAPFRVANTYIKFGYGISKAFDLIELGELYGIINKAGSWYSYNGEKIGQGRDFCSKYLEENPKIFAEVDAKIREKAFVKKEIPINLSTSSNDDEEEEVKIDE